SLNSSGIKTSRGSVSRIRNSPPLIAFFISVDVAMLIFFNFLIQQLIYAGYALSSAHTGRHKAVLLALPAQLVEYVYRQASARRPKRMPQGNSATVRIKFCLINAQLAHYSK